MPNGQIKCKEHAPGLYAEIPSRSGQQAGQSTRAGGRWMRQGQLPKVSILGPPCKQDVMHQVPRRCMRWQQGVEDSIQCVQVGMSQPEIGLSPPRGLGLALGASPMKQE